MKALIMAGVILFFIGIVSWKVMRASRSEGGCGCDEGCIDNCDCHERKHLDG